MFLVWDKIRSMLCFSTEYRAFVGSVGRLLLGQVGVS